MIMINFHNLSKWIIYILASHLFRKDDKYNLCISRNHPKLQIGLATPQEQKHTKKNIYIKLAVKKGLLIQWPRHWESPENDYLWCVDQSMNNILTGRFNNSHIHLSLFILDKVGLYEPLDTTANTGFINPFNIANLIKLNYIVFYTLYIMLNIKI